MSTPSSSPLAVLLVTVLPAGLSAVHEAREHVRRACAGWPAPAREVARLLTSELVTNAVRHGSGSVELTIRGNEDGLRVEVSDHNPDLVRGSTTDRPDGEREGGRGLSIVDALADDWGVAREGKGKTVWFGLRRSANLPGS